MSLQTFFDPAHILLKLILALSVFNLVTFLWLAVTVWLNGNRRAWIARLGVIGLGFSAFFFFIHALLMSGSLTQPSGLISQDFLWHLIWLPALSVPYIWFAIGLHYASLISDRWRRRRPVLLICSGILGCLTLVLLIVYQATFTFANTLRLLAYGDLLADTHSETFLLPVILPILFLIYVTFCAIGPWFTVGRTMRLLHVLLSALYHRIRGADQNTSAKTPLRRRLSNAFWDDPTDVNLLEEPILSWHLARPGLFFAAILMVTLTTTLGILGLWSITDWLGTGESTIQSLPLQTVPLNLLILDILATGGVALIILLVGYSIVRHGVLIERPLARRGFLEQWRGIVIVATTVALLIVLLVTVTQSNLGSLLIITSLATCAYALFTWSSYTAHDRYIKLLEPFMSSSNLRHWLRTDLQKTEQGLEALFFHLCREVLAVQCARLTVVAGAVRRSFNYRWPVEANEQLKHALPKFLPRNERSDTKPEVMAAGNQAARVQLMIGEQSMICWILPIYDELGLVAMLYLGPREDGGTFTDEDMELAQACGQRILDTLADHEAMQAVAGLLRRRIVDVKLLGAQQRRVLHDDILPQMHLALLRLETLRSYIGNGHDQGVKDGESPEKDQQPNPEQVLNEAVEMISGTHRQLAAMMRATAPGSPHRLERDGLMHAIQTMLEQDFQYAFDEVEWVVSEETARYIDEVTPPAIAELIFAAVQEALRNAARHARGADVHRRLHLTLKAICDPTHPDLVVVVADDGVGIISASSSTTGTGGGLLTHSALLAIAGGSLTIKSAPDEGACVRIVLPVESLR